MKQLFQAIGNLHAYNISGEQFCSQEKVFSILTAFAEGQPRITFEKDAAKLTFQAEVKKLHEDLDTVDENLAAVGKLIDKHMKDTGSKFIGREDDKILCHICGLMLVGYKEGTVCNCLLDKDGNNPIEVVPVDHEYYYDKLSRAGQTAKQRLAEDHQKEQVPSPQEELDIYGWSTAERLIDKEQVNAWKEEMEKKDLIKKRPSPPKNKIIKEGAATPVVQSSKKTASWLSRWTGKLLGV